VTWRVYLLLGGLAAALALRAPPAAAQPPTTGEPLPGASGACGKRDRAAASTASPLGSPPVTWNDFEITGEFQDPPETVHALFAPVMTRRTSLTDEARADVSTTAARFGYHVMVRAAGDPLESTDILAREPEAGPVYVQHVLIAWKDLFAARNGRADKRAQDRSKADADKLAKEILGKVRGNADIVKLMKEYSEDPGSKDTGKAYEITTATPFVPEFKDLALRLKMGESGVVKSQFGWHVMKRVPPPPPDPLESADILKREPVTQTAKVKHILVNWSGGNPRDERAKKRDRATLEKLVKSMTDRLRAGAKIEPLMADVSEDPGSATTGKSYDVTPDAGLVEPFKKLSLRLKVGEFGVVKTDFGYHIIQRVE